MEVAQVTTTASATVANSPVTETTEPEAQESEEQQEAAEEQVAAEEEAKEASTRSPIVRPVSIVNTRRLTTESIISEPVTSGGNPNLLGGTGLEGPTGSTPGNTEGPGQ